MSFNNLLCSLGRLNEGCVPIGGLLLLQVAEGIGFKDGARRAHGLRNICRLERQRKRLIKEPEWLSQIPAV